MSLAMPAPRPATERAEELSVLRWAAGAPAPPPEAVDAYADWLIPMLTQHRLARPFMARALRERPQWYRGRIFSWAAQHAASEEKWVRRAIAAAREVGSALRHTGSRPVFVKGFSTYALTGDSRHVHYSCDLDLLHGDTGRLDVVLGASGFAVKYTRVLFEHATLSRGDVVLDVHSFLPVYSYPPGMARTDMRRERNPAHWRQSFGRPPLRRLQYADLLEGAVPGVTDDTRDLLFPEPAMSAFAICTHVFREYALEWPYSGPPLVSLYELAAVRDLALLPTFDRARFTAAVRRYCGADAVGFVATLLQAHLGANPLPVRLRDGEGLSHFPRYMGWWRCWAAVETPDDVLLPSDIGALVEALGANDVRATRDGEPAWYTIGALEQRTPLKYYIAHSTTGRAVSLGLSAQWDESALTLRVLSPEPPPAGRRKHLFGTCQFDGEFPTIYISVNEGGFAPRSNSVLSRLPSGCIEVHPAGEGYVLLMRIPWAALPESLGADGEIKFLMAAGTYERDFREVFDLEPAVAAGIRIVRP